MPPLLQQGRRSGWAAEGSTPAHGSAHGRWHQPCPLVHRIDGQRIRGDIVGDGQYGRRHCIALERDRLARTTDSPAGSCPGLISLARPFPGAAARDFRPGANQEDRNAGRLAPALANTQGKWRGGNHRQAVTWAGRLLAGRIHGSSCHQLICGTTANRLLRMLGW